MPKASKPLAGGLRHLTWKRTKDYDIVTDATPDQVESLFDKTVPIGSSLELSEPSRRS